MIFSFSLGALQTSLKKVDWFVIKINISIFNNTNDLSLIIMIFESGFEAVREVARHGSFTNAAKALGVSGPAVSRQVKSLEERLGLVLFHRTTRMVTLTEAGQQLVDTLDRGSDEVSGLIERLAEGQERPFGKLRLNAPMAFGEKFLVGPIAEYASLYPDVIVDIEFDDRRVHLVEEGYDLIIRIGALEDTGLIAKKLCDFPTIICASPGFLAHHGHPRTPSDLTRLPAVVYSNSASGNSMNYRTANGDVGVVNLSPAIYANSIGMLLEATKQGLGFSRLPEVFCAEALNEGTLIETLSEYDLIPDRAIFVMYPEKRYLPLKVRKFIDHLSARLSVMKNY
ncbi:MAG: LysR family transcriptional regulator [Alphaproteobacteria bacterium]